MTSIANGQIVAEKAYEYATGPDFCRIFIENLKGLYQLAFLLTRDQEKAGQCLVDGIEDSVKGNRVYKEWARAWAKRIVVGIAIRKLKPESPHTNSLPTVDAFFHSKLSSSASRHFEVDAVLALEDFDRFVFVLTVLEHYHDRESSLLLGCSLSEIREGRTRALQTLAESVPVPSHS